LSDRDEQRSERLPPEAPGGIRNLQVGCGPEHIRPDWWNTDLRAFRGIDETLDAVKPWRWKGILEHIYAEHFLEHLDLEDALHFLENAGHALKIGGHIRLSTPGLEWVMRSHYRFLPGVPEQVIDTLRTNRAFHGWGHQFLYSRGMLAWLLEELGFVDLRFHGYGESERAIFCNIEMHGKYRVADGYPSVWIVEASRGDRPVAISKAVMALVRREFLRQVRGGH
jgi:predicted SAM-dependent methyltransferase